PTCRAFCCRAEPGRSALCSTSPVRARPGPNKSRRDPSEPGRAAGSASDPHHHQSKGGGPWGESTPRGQVNAKDFRSQNFPFSARRTCIKLMNRTPFAPFEIHLSDGERIRVEHPYEIATRPKSRTCIIIYEEDEGVRIVAFRNITEVVTKASAG